MRYIFLVIFLSSCTVRKPVFVQSENVQVNADSEYVEVVCGAGEDRLVIDRETVCSEEDLASPVTSVIMGITGLFILM